MVDNLVIYFPYPISCLLLNNGKRVEVYRSGSVNLECRAPYLPIDDCKAIRAGFGPLSTGLHT